MTTTTKTVVVEETTTTGPAGATTGAAAPSKVAVDPTSLEFSTVVITGVTGNIGSGLAKAAQEKNANLVFVVRSGQAAQLRKEYPDAKKVLIIEGDVEDASACKKIAHEANSFYGRVDHVFAPIGGWWQKAGQSHAQHPADLAKLLTTFVQAQFNLVHAFAPYLETSQGSYTMVTGTVGERLTKDCGLLVVAVGSSYQLSAVLRSEISTFRFNELRIDTRVEKVPTGPDVVSAVDAGRVFIEIANNNWSGRVIGYGKSTKHQLQDRAMAHDIAREVAQIIEKDLHARRHHRKHVTTTTTTTHHAPASDDKK